MQVQLSEKEARALLELLQEHLYYGWIEGEGEFGVTASGRVSEALRELYRRLRQGQAKAA
ncbi:peptidylprolyl isomerase [Meiothermus sp. Pnk-1]|jgi:hypothetical protein|uniref:peptidylprolyl isomerase n=1 Tax=Meiothermus sp. Pnk-1 TaxID=873128 RepID=UPI000D7C1B26|nr:peptidylprolyl isomerase [Meiothermus sp. Pnk-1]PZA07465.1 peptidylprolyl isomerase [Meiothermus sp. Pnk-1]